eukprot:3236516-Rhodomonas_salina.2
MTDDEDEEREDEEGEDEAEGGGGESTEEEEEEEETEENKSTAGKRGEDDEEKRRKKGKRVKEKTVAERMAEEEEEARSGVEALREAAQEGSAEAQFQLGQCYALGEGCEQNESAAYQLLLQGTYPIPLAIPIPGVPTPYSLAIGLLLLQGIYALPPSIPTPGYPVERVAYPLAICLLFLPGTYALLFLHRGTYPIPPCYMSSLCPGYLTHTPAYMSTLSLGYLPDTLAFKSLTIPRLCDLAVQLLSDTILWLYVQHESTPVIVLCLCYVLSGPVIQCLYAKCGTEIGYAATHALCDVRLCCYKRCAVCGTEIGYAATSGAEIPS